MKKNATHYLTRRLTAQMKARCVSFSSSIAWTASNIIFLTSLCQTGLESFVNKTHMCVNLGFFPGISSCERRKVDTMKSQLSFADCFTALT